MNKCYYCNNSQRGCDECRKQKVEALKPVWRALDMGEAGESLKLVERHPIKDDRKLERVLGTSETDTEDAAVYWGARAGGKMLPHQEALQAMAARVGLYRQKRAVQMLEGIFKD